MKMQACGPDGIRLDLVSKSFGGARVLDAVSVVIESGQFTVILGPSGCGKSTLLRSIAGLEMIESGTISIDGCRLDHLPPQLRGCAMVFQSYALYPHMTVEQNLSYGLKRAGIAGPELTRRVATMAEMLSLTPLLRRKPHQLSGGQRQRVAIGRAMIREPAVLLLDEPLSALDAKLRAETRIELRRLHARSGATTVMVTHDQHEAMTLADRIIVMRAGQIEQVGTPSEIYHHPATTFVAGFVGGPPMNLLEARVEAGQVFLPNAIGAPASAAVAARDGAVLLGVRPEAIVLGGAEPDLMATLDFIEDLGSHRLLYCRSGAARVIVSSSEAAVGAVGTEVPLSLPRLARRYFDIATGRSIK